MRGGVLVAVTRVDQGGVVDFDDEPQDAAFRSEARAWLEANAPAKGSERDFSGHYMNGQVDEAEFVARSREWQATLQAGGWGAVSWPVGYGGRGGSIVQAGIFAEEQARFGVTDIAYVVAKGMVGPTLIAHGTEDQKAQHLPRIISGRDIWCQLFSEPGAGSDLAGLRTAAIRDGGEFVVSGQKVWTSGAGHSQWGILLVRTDPDAPKHRGITYLLVDMASPGIEVRPLRQINGNAHFNEVFLDEVRVPVENVVGEIDGGWGVALTTLANERMAIGGSVTLSFSRTFIDLAREMGRAADPLVRQELARAYTNDQLLRYLNFRIQTALARGGMPGPEASVVKNLLSTGQRTTLSAGLATAGPRSMLQGPVAGFDWVNQWLSAPALRIAGGSEEIQRTIMGERVLGLPGEPRVDKDVPFRAIPS